MTIANFILRLLLLLATLFPCSSFLSHVYSKSCLISPLKMVRNIDLPEALIFYGAHVFQDEQKQLLPGVESLIREAREIQTPVVVLVEDDTSIVQHDHVLVISNTSPPPPNPRVLLETVQSLLIQPRGFGGSSGFGRKAADPERQPEFQHVVVFCDSVEPCRAARYVGARVVSLQDNDLADAIVDEWDELCIDDVATPGSYWLNPPHPKDDDGNRVDVHDIIDHYENHESKENDESPSKEVTTLDINDDEMARILADLDSI